MAKFQLSQKKSVEIGNEEVIFNDADAVLPLSKENWSTVYKLLEPAEHLFCNGDFKDELFIHIEGDLHMRAAFFRNKPYFHLRHFTKYHPDGKLYPTNRGISLDATEYCTLLNKKDEISDALYDITAQIGKMSKVYKTMFYSVVAEARNIFRGELLKQCKGCNDDLPWYKDHICTAWMDGSEVEHVFPAIWENIDKEHVLRIFKCTDEGTADDTEVMYERCVTPCGKKLVERILGEKYYPSPKDPAFVTVLQGLASAVFEEVLSR